MGRRVREAGDEALQPVQLFPEGRVRPGSAHPQVITLTWKNQRVLAVEVLQDIS